MLERLNNLNKQEKMLLAAGVIVAIYALYVRAQRRAAAAAAQGADGQSVTQSDDLSGLTGAINAAFGEINQGQRETQQGLSRLIGETSANTINALNASSELFTDAIQALGQGNIAAMADLSEALTDANKNLSDALKNDLKARYDGLTAQLSAQAETLADSEQRLFDFLTSSNSNLRNLDYIMLGRTSAAACFAGNGVWSAECLHVYGAESGLGRTTEQAMQSWAEGEYRDCFQNNRYDLVCVGKRVAQRFNVQEPAGQQPGQGGNNN